MVRIQGYTTQNAAVRQIYYRTYKGLDFQVPKGFVHQNGKACSVDYKYVLLKSETCKEFFLHAVEPSDNIDDVWSLSDVASYELNHFPPQKKVLSIRKEQKEQTQRNQKNEQKNNQRVTLSNVNYSNIRPRTILDIGRSISEDLHTPFKSESYLQKFISESGAILPGKHIVTIGSPGSGKTTLMMYMLAELQRQNPDKKFLFISAEMDEIELEQYRRKLKIISDISTLCLPTIRHEVDENDEPIIYDWLELIKQTLNEGYDFVLTDSIAKLASLAVADNGWKTNNFTKSFLSLCDRHRGGKNTLNKFTTFVSIQQETKGEDFVGSNAIKHDTTAMLQILKGKDNRRYVTVYGKNRMGTSMPHIQNLYFDIINGELVFNEAEIKKSEQIAQFAEIISMEENRISEAELIASAGGVFDTAYADFDLEQYERELQEA